MRRSTFDVLTRHFVQTIVAPPILTDLGVDFLRRTIASLVAILFVLGIFLPRVLFKKYADLGGDIYPDAYLRALQADTLLMIAVPMLIIGIAAVVLCPMLFPDETDYRVLTPLPITRLQIFTAKLAALALVVAVGVVAVNAIASVWFPLVTIGSFRRAPHPLLARMGAHAAAAVSGSVWMFSAVMALQGLCLVALPHRWRRRAGLALQASLFLLLLLSVPFALRVPGMLVSRDTVTVAPLIWLPPAWFLGLEQWLLGGADAGGYVTAAAVAGAAAVSTVLIIAVTYALLYRSAERLAGMSGEVRRRSPNLVPVVSWFERRSLIGAPTAAVMSFAARGLTRSRLHQFVFLLIVGAGCALLVGQIMTAVEGAPLDFRPRTAVHAAIAAPLLVALSVTLGLRQILLLPIDLAAVWVFRLTEDPRTRPAALDGVAHLFTLSAVIPALVVASVLQPRILGDRWLLCALLTTLASLVLVEFVLADWARIPYTCTYLPGKRVMAYTIGVLFAAYAVFVYIGASLMTWSILHPSRTMVMGGLLLAVFAFLRRARVRTWGTQPLEFEDEDPLAVRTLGLLPDER